MKTLKNNKTFSKVGKTVLISALTLCSASLLNGCSKSNSQIEPSINGNIWHVQNYAPTQQTEGHTGDMFLNSSTYDLYRKADYGWVFVGNIKGSDGKDGEIGDRGWKGENGDEIQLNVTDTHIQWKYENSNTWTNLIPLSSLKGSTGEIREIEFQTTSTHIQWRYIATENENQNDFQWENLVSLSELVSKGERGATWHVENFEPSQSYEAKIGDLFLNTLNYDIFKLTETGWVNLGNIKGSSPTIEINSSGYWVVNGISTDVLADQSKAEVTGEVLAINYLETSEFAGKKITIFGDSITNGVGATSKELGYASLLATKLGVTVENFGANGTTLCDGIVGSDQVSVSSRLSEVINYNDSTDYFILQLGTNDWIRSVNSKLQLGALGSNNTNTVYGALNVYASTLTKKFENTNTKIIFLTPTICKTSNVYTFDSSVENKLGYNLRDICNAIIETANLYDINVIDLNLDSGIYYNSEQDNNTNEYMKDIVHPNDAGHALIANVIVEYLQNNLTYINRSETKHVSLRFYSPENASVKAQIKYVVNGGKYKLPTCPKEKVSYTFKHWQDEDGNIYYPNDILTINDNITLEAVYAENITITVNNIIGNETSTTTTSIAFSNNIDQSTNKLISEPLSSVNLSQSYGLVPTFYTDENLTTKISSDITFLEGNNPSIYVNWETNPNWFTISNGVITGKNTSNENSIDNYPTSYNANTAIEKLIFPKFAADGTAITGINSSSFFINLQTDAEVYKNLKALYFPKGYTSISGNFFMTARNTIDVRSFSSFSVYIPSSLTSIPEGALSNMNIKEFIVEEENSAYCSVNRMLYNKQKNKLIHYVDVYSNNELVTEFSIPANVTSLGSQAFYGNKNLTKLVIPESITSSLGGNVLSEMNSLLILDIKCDVAKLPLSLFQNLSNSQLSKNENAKIYVKDETSKETLTNLLQTNLPKLANIIEVAS